MRLWHLRPRWAQLQPLPFSLLFHSYFSFNIFIPSIMTALRGSLAIESHKSDDTTDRKGHQRTFLPINSAPSGSSREKRRHNSSCAECQQAQQQVCSFAAYSIDHVSFLTHSLQCQRGTLAGRCIRCAQHKYPCTTLLVDEVEKPKRRKLESQSCSYCRQDEHKV